jgi:hypothetical protein
MRMTRCREAIEAEASMNNITYRVTATKLDDGGIMVCVLQFIMDCWITVDVIVGTNISEMMMILDDRLSLTGKTILVQEANGDWVEPDAITVGEALEATLFEGIS